LSRPHNPPTSSQPSAPSPPAIQSAGLLPEGSEGVELIKPAVRAQPGYTLVSPPARYKLNQNESPYDFPAALKREVAERVAGLPWQRYPDFAPADLQSGLASYYGWVPEGVLVGNGSNELIQSALAVTLGNGDAVVSPSPTFSLYRLLTGVFGARYVPVPLRMDFSFDIPGLIETARQERARVIVLNSPNNPTGSALPEGAVQRLLEETRALVICDEAYQEFGGPTAIPLLRRSSRVVVLRTFSKAFGLAGLRFGLALGHPAVVRELSKGKLPYNVNIITLAAARVALEHAPALRAQAREVIAVRERFLVRLQRLRGIVVYPTAANFVLVRCEALAAREIFRRLQGQYGILVRDVSSAPELAECLRISIGTEDAMEAVIGALEEILTEGGKGGSREVGK
jgi:histidinol-phosphate aminotransferase